MKGTILERMFCEVQYKNPKLPKKIKNHLTSKIESKFQPFHAMRHGMDPCISVEKF